MRCFNEVAAALQTRRRPLECKRLHRSPGRGLSQTVAGRQDDRQIGALLPDDPRKVDADLRARHYDVAQHKIEFTLIERP